MQKYFISFTIKFYIVFFILSSIFFICRLNDKYSIFGGNSFILNENRFNITKKPFIINEKTFNINENNSFISCIEDSIKLKKDAFKLFISIENLKYIEYFSFKEFGINDLILNDLIL